MPEQVNGSIWKPLALVVFSMVVGWGASTFSLGDEIQENREDIVELGKLSARMDERLKSIDEKLDRLLEE